QTEPPIWVVNRVPEQIRAHHGGFHGDDQQQRRSRRPEYPRVTRAAVMHDALRLESEIGRTVRRERDSSEDRNRYRIPVEQYHVAAWREIGEECHGERAVGIKRNTAGHIARRRAEKDGQKRIAEHEDEIPEPLPHAIVDVAAGFQRDSAQYQTPQDEKEREVIAGKG